MRRRSVDFLGEQAALKQTGRRGVARAAGADREGAGAREVGEGALDARQDSSEPGLGVGDICRVNR